MEQTHFESQKVNVHEEVPFLSPLINELYKDTCVCARNTGHFQSAHFSLH